MGNSSISKTQLYWYNSKENNFQPISSKGDSLELFIPKVELYWYDESTNSYKPLVTDGKMPVSQDLIDSATRNVKGDIDRFDTIQNQTDFVKLLREHNPNPPSIKARILGDRNVEVSIPLGGEKVAIYTVEKDINDDFMKFQEGAIGRLVTQHVEVGHSSYEGTVGTWYKLANNINHYTRTVGDTAYGTFTGTGMDINTYVNHQGGMWKIVVDGVHEFTWTTNSQAYEGITTSVQLEAFRELDNKEHSWVATFLGDDPDYPPSDGAGTSRGWFKSGSSYDPIRTDKSSSAIIHFELGTAPVIDVDVLVNSSNKEFAFNCKPSNTNETHYWFPDHGTGTAFAGEQSVLFDDVLIADWTPQKDVQDVQVVKIIQKMDMIHPSDPQPLAEAFVIHTITASGVSYKVNWKWLKPTRISSGYVHMFPVARPFTEMLRTSVGNSYQASATSGRTWLMDENEYTSSYAFYNESSEEKYRDVVVAMTIFDIKNSFRHGKPNRLGDYINSSLVWLEHRNEYMQKLYPHVYSQHDAVAGEEHSFGATIYVGLLPYAKELLK